MNHNKRGLVMGKLKANAFLSLISFGISFGTFAGSINLDMTGSFKKVTPFIAFGYSSVAECREDGGIFDIMEGYCEFLEGGSTVEIKKISNEKYSIAVSSVGRNFHMCDYQADATKLNDVQLISETKDEYSNEVCKVELRFTNKDTLSVVTSPECSAYCGAGMSLDLENAKREK
jgi:hypothetical protein